MASSIEYILKLSTNGQTVLSQLQRKTENWGNSLNSVAKKFSSSMDLLANSAVFDNLERAATRIDSFTESGASLNQALKETQAITKVTDTALSQIEKSARKSAVTFGTNASDNVESYKVYLSKLSPELVKNAEAMDMMGYNANLLSKQMKGDTFASANLLSTAMNQFGVDLTNPIQAAKEQTKMMHLMSQAASVGSAELPQIGEALEKAGANARLANITFAETNAAIQILDKTGKVGAEGGTALASAFAIMGKGRFMPKDVLTGLQKAGVDINKISDKSLSLGQRLQALQPILKDSALLQAMFGEGATVAGYNLIKEGKGFDAYAKSLEGSNDAQIQADMIMSSFNEKQKRRQAFWDDLKISVFNATQEMLPFVTETTKVGFGLGEAALAYNSLETFLKSDSILKATQWVKGFSLANMASSVSLKAQALWSGIATTATNMLTASWWSANFAMLAIPVTIGAIVASIGYVIYKVDGWGAAWEKTKDGFINGGKMLVTSFKLYGKLWLEPWLWAFDQIRIGWYSVKSLWADNAQSEISSIRLAAKERQKGIVATKELLKQQAKDSAEGFKGAWGALKWNDKKSVSAGISSLFGSATSAVQKPNTPTAPNFVPPTPNGTDGGMGGAGGTGKSTTDSISSIGGTKSTHIVINLTKELVGSINISSTTLKEGVTEMERLVGEALVRVLAQAHSAAQ